MNIEQFVKKYGTHSTSLMMDALVSRVPAKYKEQKRDGVTLERYVNQWAEDLKNALVAFSSREETLANHQQTKEQNE